MIDKHCHLSRQQGNDCTSLSSCPLEYGSCVSWIRLVVEGREVHGSSATTRGRTCRASGPQGSIRCELAGWALSYIITLASLIIEESISVAKHNHEDLSASESRRAPLATQFQHHSPKMDAHAENHPAQRKRNGDAHQRVRVVKNTCRASTPHPILPRL